MTRHKNVLLPVAVCGAVLVSCFFYLLSTYAGNGSPVPGEPDTTIFLQYALSIADGHPYVFSQGDAPSTGSTSHLYPFVLAIPACFGLSGSGLIAAAYVLNAVFYILVILLAFRIASHFNRAAAPLAVVLVLLCGQTINAALGLTDIGLFMVLALSLFTCILEERYRLAALLAILCSLTRPEGFIFGTAFIICASSRLAVRRRLPDFPGTDRQQTAFFSLGLLGIGAFALTLVINHVLTGHFKFMSVANKGYFHSLPVWSALNATFTDALRILKGTFFGLPDTARQFYTFPVLGGALAMSGILLHKRNEKTLNACECWIGLSAAACIGIVASGQFQGLSHDRYLAWLYVIWLVYIALGVHSIGELLQSRRFVVVSSTILIMFQCVSMLYMASNFYVRTIQVHRNSQFSLQVAEHFPKETTFASASGVCIDEWQTGLRVYNIYGILSPAFFEPEAAQLPAHLFDLLKHRPELRFDYWYNALNYVDEHTWIQPLLGKTVLIDTDQALFGFFAHGIFETRWTSLNGGDFPLVDDSRIKEGLLVDRIDVGYLPDEQSHQYATRMRLKDTRMSIAYSTSQLGEKDYSESGRIILGSESFTVSTESSERPLYAVLRTARTANAAICGGLITIPTHHLEISSPMTLVLMINGQEISYPLLELEKDAFSELVLEIPADYLVDGIQEITVHGDHISFGYWFYQ